MQAPTRAPGTSVGGLQVALQAVGGTVQEVQDGAEQVPVPANQPQNDGLLAVPLLPAGTWRAPRGINNQLHSQQLPSAAGLGDVRRLLMEPTFCELNDHGNPMLHLCICLHFQSTFALCIFRSLVCRDKMSVQTESGLALLR